MLPVEIKTETLDEDTKLLVNQDENYGDTDSEASRKLNHIKRKNQLRQERFMANPENREKRNSQRRIIRIRDKIANLMRENEYRAVEEFYLAKANLQSRLREDFPYNTSTTSGFVEAIFFYLFYTCKVANYPFSVANFERGCERLGIQINISNLLDLHHFQHIKPVTEALDANPIYTQRICAALMALGRPTINQGFDTYDI